jgi:hypothetical protein
MGSRISAEQAAWLIDRGTTAPWSAIRLDAQLKQADPLAIGGLYDRAAAVWEHFWDARPAGISTAKISKVLYLMRPGLFPILDSYLTRLYRPAARTFLERKLMHHRLGLLAAEHVRELADQLAGRVEFGGGPGARAVAAATRDDRVGFRQSARKPATASSDLP